MKFRIIQNVEGCGHVKTEGYNIVAFVAATGLEITGTNANPRQRDELQGQPRLAGFNGPMWDGDAIRYEDAQTYNQLSA